MTLDGLEYEIARHYFLTKKGKVSYHSWNNPHLLHIVRYADYTEVETMPKLSTKIRIHKPFKMQLSA